ncbi:hypothetical protein [Bifidobacterium scaligerum]|nr:hypothetical protein [Bifidobacterium scaligerum]
MMKKDYETPSAQIIDFGTADVVTLSDGGIGVGPGEEFNPNA